MARQRACPVCGDRLQLGNPAAPCLGGLWHIYTDRFAMAGTLEEIEAECQPSSSRSSDAGAAKAS